MKLLQVIRSPAAGKKWRALFRDGDREFHTDFGASGYQDFTQHHDEEKARRYRLRHRKDLLTNNPSRAGFLSYYILWGPDPSFAANLQAYKNRFHM